jgi:hypothetical protein
MDYNIYKGKNPINIIYSFAILPCTRLDVMGLYFCPFYEPVSNIRKKIMPLTGHLFPFAEREGFEPSIQV